MKKKYWFYFGMGTKEGRLVHKNGVVGADTDNCPVIDIEDSVMEENEGVTQFHVVSFQEVPYQMFLDFKEGLTRRSVTNVDATPINGEEVSENA